MIFDSGATSQSIDVQIVDDTGLPVTGLVAATFPALTYSLAGPNADVAFPALSDLATITTAYASGGVKERGNGVYRLDVPNGVFTTAGQVRIRGEATGKHVLVPIIDVAPAVNVQRILGTTSVGAAGSVGIDWAHVANPGSTVSLSATTVSVVTTATNVSNLSAGSIVATSFANNSITASAIAASALNGKGDWELSSSYPANFGALGISLGGHILNVDTLTTYTGNTPQTGDAFARLGAPAGASTAADIAAVKSDTGTILTDVNTGAGAIYTRLGAPAGASLAADIAAVEAHAANIDTQVGTAGAGLTNIGDTRMAHLDANVSSRSTLTQTQVTGGAYSLATDANGNIKLVSNVKKNQALTHFEFLMTDLTTHAPAPLKTVTVTRSIDGGAFGAGTLANVTEIGDGIYACDFGAGDLNGNVITLRATASGCDDTLERIVTDP